MALSTAFHSIHFPENSPLSNSDLLVLLLACFALLTIYLFMKVSFSPDIIHSDCLGSKHQLTTLLTLLDISNKASEHSCGTLQTRGGSFQTNRMMFVVKSLDHEMFQDHEHLATMGRNFTSPPAMKNSEAVWRNAYMHSGSYQ